MSEERRRALGIPVHTDADHTFVDGYCTCGAADKKAGGPRRHGHDDGWGRGGRTAGVSNLDRIDQNRDLS